MHEVTVLQVLVCDDEPGMRTGVMRALRDYTVRAGEVGEVRFVVDEAETGEQAVEMVEQSPPHILLLDHKLPGISGLEVLECIASKKIELLTIMITAYASIETAVRATKQGAYDFLAKPFTPAELKNAVRKAAEHVVIAQQARKLAEERRQVRFQFISVLAHELKSPLGALEGYLDLLKDPAVTSDVATYGRIIGRCQARTNYMQKMIADLLDLTRIESGQKSRELARVDLASVARGAMESAQQAADERKITLALHAPDEAPLVADHSEMEIIFNNLVSNAVKYNRDMGRVDIYLEPSEEGVTVRVSDTGIGMSEEESARLFQDFVRIRNTKTKGIYGSGLGLSIVKKLAQLYHGVASVSSESDVGTTFIVTLKNAEL